jgi:putative tricarboxylic transport membrane protein
VPRFTFGSTELLAGIDFIAAMIGLFAISEVLRNAATGMRNLPVPQVSIGNPLRGWGRLIRTHWRQQMRGNGIGVSVGALPGAGADLAAWIAYAVSRRFSRTPEKYGTGHVEGIVAASSANNAAVGSAWVPALVFGIPGDTITAIVIGVLFIHGMNPGPTLFVFNPQNIYAVFLIFILANLLLLPLGYMAIKICRQILRIPRRVLMPMILAFCVVGAFATNNAAFNVGIMLAFGVLGFFMEENDIPLAPCILGDRARRHGGEPLRHDDDPVGRRPAGLLLPADRGRTRHPHPDDLAGPDPRVGAAQAAARRHRLIPARLSPMPRAGRRARPRHAPG